MTHCKQKVAMATSDRMVIDKICKITVKGAKSMSESFFSISLGVLELWRKDFRGVGGFPPGLDRVKVIEVKNWGLRKHLKLGDFLLYFYKKLEKALGG